MDEWRQQDVDAWKLVKQYVAEHNKLPPRGVMYQDYPLGEWCECVREYKRRQMDLPPSSLEGLASIPEWSWDQWPDHLSQLREYVAKFNELPTRNIFYNGSTHLGWMVLLWRQQYQKGELPQDRIDALEAIPVWTWDL